MTDDLVERAAHAANIKRTNMTEISKEWCINMAKQEEGDIGAGKLAIDPTSDNFHKLALSESFERVAKVAEERQEFNEQMALNDRGAQANTIEELRAANERWAIAFNQAEERANERIEALQADNAKLREKLELIALGMTIELDEEDGPIQVWMDAEELSAIARKALQETER